MNRTLKWLVLQADTLLPKTLHPQRLGPLSLAARVKKNEYINRKALKLTQIYYITTHLEQQGTHDTTTLKSIWKTHPPSFLFK